MPSGYWDIHNHILPGVDDGASCMEETYDLLAEEYRQGVRNIIFTPHHRPKLFRVSIKDRESVYWKVCRQMHETFPDMHFYLGCEFYVHDRMEEELADIRCRMARTNVVLAEFPTAGHFTDMKRHVQEILRQGYHLIIAHAERYRCLYTSGERLAWLRQAGALVQLNAGSILGREGSEAKRFCIKALQDGHADFIASDAHNMENRPVQLAECRARVMKKFGSRSAAWWFGLAQEKLFGEY